MQIKVIKKDSDSTQKNENPTQNNESVNLNSETKSPKPANVEKRAEKNISQWISDLRKKKELEFLNSQSFLQGLRPAV
jgi:hypothetical protein